MAALSEALEFRNRRLLPLLKQLDGGRLERGELRVSEDGGFDFGNRDPQLAVAGAAGAFKQCLADAGQNFPMP